jgi:hypothetical protein
MATDVRRRGVSYGFDSKIITNGAQTYQVKGSNSITWDDVRTGVGYPNWRHVIKSGGNATTGFSASENGRFRVPVAMSAHLIGPKNGISQDTYFWTFTDDRGTYNTTDPAILSPSRAENLAREQFIQFYRARRTAFQSGVFLGELNQVVQMIRSPAQKLRTLVNDIREDAKRRVRGKRGKQFQQATAATWLEYQFGVKPLVGDIEAAFSLAKACPERFRQPIHAESTIEHKIEPVNTQVPAPGVGYPVCRYIYSQTCRTGVRYSGAVDATRYPPPSFNEQAGVSWSNVLPTAWELVPYSFLIDYFANIGKMIEGISTGIVKLAWGACNTKLECETRFMTEVDTAHMKNALGSNYTWHASVDGSGKVGHRKALGRTRITEISFGGISDFQFKVPAAHSTKWLNIAALAVMRTTDKKVYAQYVR